MKLAFLLILGACAILAAILYWLPKIRAIHIEQDDLGLPCESCGRPTDDYSPWSCAIHLTPICSEPCKLKHRSRVHA
jgi:hypothetical protein